MTESLKATLRGVDATQGIGSAGDVKCKVGTVAVTAAAAQNSTYSFGKIPSNARILGISKLHSDDLASSGSPTIDLGLFAVNGNITSDDDALNDGIDVATEASSSSVVKAIENYGKKAYEFVSGQTTDPKGELEVKATLKDADANLGGDITLELFYTID